MPFFLPWIAKPACHVATPGLAVSSRSGACAPLFHKLRALMAATTESRHRLHVGGQNPAGGRRGGAAPEWIEPPAWSTTSYHQDLCRRVLCRMRRVGGSLSAWAAWMPSLLEFFGCRISGLPVPARDLISSYGSAPGISWLSSSTVDRLQDLLPPCLTQLFVRPLDKVERIRAVARRDQLRSRLAGDGAEHYSTLPPRFSSSTSA